MRPSSKVPSSTPTVKSTQRVPGMASGQRCEYLVAGLVERRQRDGRTAAIGDAQQPRRLRRRHDDRSVGRPRRAARIAADVRHVDHRPAADRDLGQLALGEERQPSPVRREERLPGAVRAGDAAQRRIAQLAQVEPPGARPRPRRWRAVTRPERGRMEPRTPARTPAAPGARGSIGRPARRRAPSAAAGTPRRAQPARARRRQPLEPAATGRRDRAHGV